MYQFINAVLLPKGKNKTWVNTDISMVYLYDVFRLYEDGYIVLTDTANPGQALYLDYKTLKTMSIRFYNMIFETWLLTQTVGSLSTTLIEPVIIKKNVLYSDALQALFMVNKIGNDLWLHKDNISTDSLHKRVLTSVNGLLHYNSPAPDEESLIITNGSKSTRPGLPNAIGLWSFNDIGDVIQTRITGGMLYNTSPSITRYQNLIIKTSINAIGKTVLLSIAGFMHALDNVYDVINENPLTIMVKPNKIDWVMRLFELTDIVSVKELGLSESFYAPDAIANGELETDSFINAVLTLPQSFVVIVDTPRMHADKELAINPNIVGFYESLKEPLFPLLSNTGRELGYWRKRQVDKWVCVISPNMKPKYLITTTEYMQERVVNRTLSEEGQVLHTPYFLNLCSQSTA